MEDYYPCVGALIKIGSPALPSVIDAATQSSNDEEVRSASYVIYKVLGPEVADAYVLDCLKKEKNIARFQKLTEVQSLIRSFK